MKGREFVLFLKHFEILDKERNVSLFLREKVSQLCVFFLYLLFVIMNHLC